MSSTLTYTDQELLQIFQQRFFYSEGQLFSKKTNQPVGFPTSRDNAYLKINISISGKKFNFRVHRIIFLLHHGFLPETVDHINGIITDNRLENLREATFKQNSMNMKRTRRNTSGFKGVSRETTKCPARPWRADIRINGKNITLGHFATPEEAAAAYQAAAAEHFDEFARFE